MDHLAARQATTGATRALAITLLALVLSLAPAAIVQAAASTDPCAAPAASQYLAANASETGVINLIFFDAEGSPVVFSECVRGRLRRVGTATSAPNTMTQLTTTWSCVRNVRRFLATTTLPSGNVAAGAFSVRTPSCAQRFELNAPRRVKPGASARIRVVDRWGIGGIRPELCITAPGEKRACRKMPFGKAVAVAGRHFRASRRGRWRVELRVRRHRVRAMIAVGGERPAVRKLPTLLATGDSTMQGIDNFLADDLGAGVRVHSDVRPGTGIAKLNPWAQISVQDTRRLRPSATVISIGANDAWPMTTAAGAEHVCCGEAWIAEYAQRVQAMMRTYARAGRGRVVWLTLPIPRDPRRVEIFAAVNRAVLLAAGGMPAVRILRIDRLFSPSGAYQETISHRGRVIDVREPDGIHLNVSGSAIAARAVAQVLGGR